MLKSVHENRTRSLERRSWWLWLAAFALLFSLTVTIPALYLPLIDLLGVQNDAEHWVREGYNVFVGLGGLMTLFCLFTVNKQAELHRVRAQLEREVREHDDVRNRLSEVSALFTLATTLNLHLRLEVVLEIIVRRVVSTLRAQQASIMLYNPESGVLETRATYGLESEFARNAKARLGEGIAGWVAERKEALLLGPDERNKDFTRHYKSNRNITSALSLPLRVGDRCVGVLNVNRINHPDSFQEHHRETLRLFAEHVGAVIERAETLERLAKRTQVLEESNLQLSELNRVKDVFLSTATHELKTPLTSVIAYAELLEHHEGRLGPEQQSEFLRRLRNEARRLLGLIDDILDLQRIETGKLVIERVPVTLDTIVEASLETTTPIADKYKVAMRSALAADPPMLEVDEVKMRQVVVNLLVNAIKFSPEGSTIEIRTLREEDFAVLEVEDHGPGVRPEDSAHIFALFGQGVRDRESTRTAGLGIGLHLVRRLTELQGGHVGVNSTAGRGSTFWVRIPLPVTPALKVRMAA
ncbi:MAG: GAF domain-containing protein [Candidatus Eisenbacteria bacterium]|uniref:histidine kinase n=1 Tax=Eiseniibacteriota bacterium TaxID=2212470 RepID=A0A849SW03_UNCEI|nr:GAF domain-containing protein [Candidatus Eisenbacteria bacterium]